MDLSKTEAIAAVVRRMVEESERRARRLAKLREGVAAGTYRTSAKAIAAAVMRLMRS